MPSVDSVLGFGVLRPVRLSVTPAPSLNVKESFLVEHGISLQHEVDDPGQFLSQDGQRFGLVMLVGQFFQPDLGVRILSEKQHRGLTEGPFQVGVAQAIWQPPPDCILVQAPRLTPVWGSPSRLAEAATLWYCAK